MNQIKRNESKSVVIYARSATWHPDGKKNIDDQVSVLKKFADEQGYEVVKEYREEGVSGTRLNRPELDKLKEDAAENTWKIVLVSDHSRLARSPIVYSAIIQELSEKGIEVEVVSIIKERIYLNWLEWQMSDETGKFFMEAKSDMAQRRAQIAAGDYE
jgi:DNA invertase Pin-like site-specific DNA recombinase